MAIFQHDVTCERFDDGLNFFPSEEGYTRDLAEAHFGNPHFSYVSNPDWVPPADEGDAA